MFDSMRGDEKAEVVMPWVTEVVDGGGGGGCILVLVSARTCGQRGREAKERVGRKRR